MDDDELLAGVRSDDAAAAEAFVSKFAPRIRLTLRTFGVVDSDVDDVVQDVLMDAFRQIRLGRFEGRSQLFSWIHHIVRGKAVDHRRSVGRRASETTSLDSSVDLGLAVTVSPAQEAIVAASEALERMPVRLQLVLRLYYRQSVPVGAIAEALGLSEKRIRALLTEAKARFRNALQLQRPRGENLSASKRLINERHANDRGAVPGTVTK